MPTTQFLAEWNDLTPMAAKALYSDYLTNRFTAETRKAACEDFIKVAYEIMNSGEEAEDAPKLLSVTDFMKETGEPPAGLVSEFLPSNKLILLAGAPKEGKSLVALEMLQSVSEGGALFGEFDIPTGGGVVYFGMEDGAYEIKERLTQRGLVESDNFFVVSDTIDLSSPGGWCMFMTLIAAMPLKPSLIVVDTLREAFKGVKDHNDSAQIGPPLSQLRRWAHKNCAVILIHHTNKDKFATGVDKISNSGAIVSSCDGAMILKDQKLMENGDLQWSLSVIGGRGMKRSEHKLEMDTTNLHVRSLNESEKERAEQTERTNDRKRHMSRILDFVSNREPFTVAYICEGTGLSERYTRDLLSEMVQAGFLAKAKRVKVEGSRGLVQTYVRITEGANNDGGDDTAPTSERSAVVNHGENTEFPSKAANPDAAKERVNDFMDEAKPKTKNGRSPITF